MEQIQLTTFLDELAGSGATPGGGSAAALLGAMGAALLSMVCNLTRGKQAYADVQTEIAALLEQSEALRAALLGMIDTDIEAFRGVMEVYRMPAGTDAERAARRPLLQTALRQATETPLECAAAAARVLELAQTAAAIGNRNVLSDAGVAALAAQAALRSAALNVRINLGSLEDRDYARTAEQRLTALLDGNGERLEEILEVVQGRIA